MDSSVVGYYGGQDARDEVRSLEEKDAHKRGQEPKKGIWTAVKDNAALVTAILALLGVLITGAINTYIANKDQLAQQKLELFNAQRQREVEEQKAQDAALQTYLDQMGSLLLERDLRASKEASEVRSLARARTLTVLSRVDPSRKTAVGRFLVEAALVQRVEESSPVISLANANLRGTDLSTADLGGANLSNANLSGADLSNANLSDANLSFANLSHATLEEAYLSNALLRGTDLSNADLSDAYLGGADLSGVHVTQEQLDEAASLEGATMPDGQKYEDWLKDREPPEG